MEVERRVSFGIVVVVVAEVAMAGVGVAVRGRTVVLR